MKNKKAMNEGTHVSLGKEEELTAAKLVTALMAFPPETKVDLMGGIKVVAYDDEVNHELLNDLARAEKMITDDLDEEEFFNEECCCECDNSELDAEIVKYTDDAYRDHLYGRNNYPEYHESLRNTSSDSITAMPIMTPNFAQIKYEYQNLSLPQRACVDEIRKHNADMADMMAELYRRQLAAMFEYQTQCMTHFAKATNKTMCAIIDDAVIEHF